MLSLFGASINARHIGNLSISSLPSSLQTLIPILCNLKLQCKFQFNLCHSMNRPKIADLSAPRIDYSSNKKMAQLNWMITEYSREGRIAEARHIFDEIHDPDVITWTTVISGYIKCGMIREARKMFDREDAKKNVVTWTAMISGYMRMNHILEAEKLFSEMPQKNVISWNTMIDGYVQNGLIDSALSLFEKMPDRNIVSSNTIITGLAQCGRTAEAWMLFDQMPERDVISWTAMIAGLSKNGRIDEARMLFDSMPERNVVSWNAMITGYAQNEKIDEAFDLFEKMPKRDLPSWNTMITGFIQNGDLQRAKKLFNQMPRKNVVSWTAMITGFVLDCQSEEALRIFSRMQAANGVKPNQGTFVSVLRGCSNLAGLSEGQQIHQIICKTVYQGNDFVVSALISMYSKCGELSTARKMFDDGLASKRDLVSWNGMIAAYAHHGCGKEAIDLFKEMCNLGFKPNDVTYVGLLSACSHAGFVEEGLTYFAELMRGKSIQVREDHYACLVDLCGRTGGLKEAFDFIESLSTKPSACIWAALLAGCNVHGNANLGKLAAKKLLEVEPENSSNYLLLANIYASSGKWREAAKVRLEMKDKGLKKQPGCSWIEVDNRVNVFVVGDKSHCGSKILYSLLRDLHKKLKKTGYEPSNDYMVDK